MLAWDSRQARSRRCSTEGAPGGWNRQLATCTEPLDTTGAFALSPSTTFPDRVTPPAASAESSLAAWDPSW